ncbi:MAG: toxin-antitoxin system YwqK family antitoxin [Candidatus Zixiibacteriota bacterium]
MRYIVSFILLLLPISIFGQKVQYHQNYPDANFHMTVSRAYNESIIDIETYAIKILYGKMFPQNMGDSKINNLFRVVDTTNEGYYKLVFNIRARGSAIPRPTSLDPISLVPIWKEFQCLAPIDTQYYSSNKAYSHRDTVIVGYDDVVFLIDGSLGGSILLVSLRIDTVFNFDEIKDTANPLIINTTNDENPFDWTMVNEVYYEDGQIHSKSYQRLSKTPKKGLRMKHGTYYNWAENGQLIEETEYSEGITNGKTSKWYIDGTPKEKGEYTGKDILHGHWTYWDSTGKITAEGYFDSGTGRWYYPDGQTKSVQYYNDGNNNGDWFEYYENGVIKSESHYINGTKVGDWCEYYENGDLKTKKHFVNDTRVGEWYEYYENGNVKYFRKYDDGKLVDGYLNHPTGAFKYEYPHDKFRTPPQDWYSNGNQMWIRKDAEYLEFYRDGTPKRRTERNLEGNFHEGLHREWYPDGSIKVEGQYSGGGKTGIWKFYSESGELIKEEQY